MLWRYKKRRLHVVVISVARLANFFVKGQSVNIPGFVGNVGSHATTQFCSFSAKAAHTIGR